MADRGDLVQELEEKAKEMSPRWLGVGIEKWFGGGHEKPFAGKITELWVMKDKVAKPKLVVHVLYEDNDEEDMDLGEAATYVKNTAKRVELAKDVDSLKKKKKRSRDSAGSSGEGASLKSSGGGGGETKRPKTSGSAKTGQSKTVAKEGRAKESAPMKKGAAAAVKQKAANQDASSRKEKPAPEKLVVDRRREETSKYLKAMSKLIKDGRLEPGVGNVSATYQGKTVTADLLVDGTVRRGSTDKEEERVFNTSEEFAALAFSTQDGEGGVITITINGKPLGHWENLMVPALASFPITDQQALKDDKLRRWLEDMEKAIGVLESAVSKGPTNDESEARGSDSNSSTEGAKRDGELALRERVGVASGVLKQVMAKIETALKQDDKPATATEMEVVEADGVAAPAALVEEEGNTEQGAEKAKTFGGELVRLYWLAQLHGKIEQKLAALLNGIQMSKEATDLQEEVAKSFGEEVSEVWDKTTPLNMNVAQLADLRYQLKCMVQKAQTLLGSRQSHEDTCLTAARTSFECQAGIYQEVRRQEEALDVERKEMEAEMRSRVACSEQEVELLKEALEKKKKELEDEKLDLMVMQRANEMGMELVKQKKQRWQAKLEETRKIYDCSRQRLDVLEDVHTYLETLLLESPMQEHMQSFLNRLCAECCKAWSRNSHLVDVRVRCRIRLAYEYFSLVKRLWGGDISVEVDLDKMSSAFEAVYVQPETDIAPWVGMPLPLALPSSSSSASSSSAMVTDENEGILKVLCRRVATDGTPVYYVEPVPRRKSDGSEEVVCIDDVRSELGFKTLVLASAPRGDDSSAGPRLLEAVRKGVEMATQGGQDMESSLVRQHRLLLFSETSPISVPVPPFLLECMLLVHSQDYLATIARGSKKTADLETGEQEDEAMLVAAAVEPDEIGAAGPSSVCSSSVPESAGTCSSFPVTSPSWWQEMTGKEAHTFLSSGSFGDAVISAALVCKAVDAVMIANPRSPDDDADNEGDPEHLSSNALVCIKTPGQQAGRYGAPAKYMNTSQGDEQHLINYVAVAAMYARNVWGIRRVAVVDVGRSLARGTVNLFSGDHEAFFACLHTEEGSEVTRIKKFSSVCIPLRDGSDKTPSQVLRHVVMAKLLKALDPFEPELVILTSSITLQQSGGLVPEDLEFVTSELAKLAQQKCTGRLVVVLDGAAMPPGRKGQLKTTGDMGQEEEKEQEGSEGSVPGLCLKALKSANVGPLDPAVVA